MLKKMWDDIVSDPQPNRGLGKLNTKDGGGGEGGGKLTSPKSTQASPKTPASGKKGENVWRSVFHPGRNSATKRIGAEMFDKPLPNSPTVYDWLYSDGSRSKHR